MTARFGFNARKDRPLEESLRWAIDNGFGCVEFQADLPPNNIPSFEQGRIEAIAQRCAESRISLGIHTNSAVNCAEFTPLLSEAVDMYLNLNLKLAATLGCDYVIVHGGYHFTSDAERRWEASLARLKRALGWAEEMGVLLYFENHNKEPDDAEIHYIPHNVAETRRFLQEVRSSTMKWSFNVAHGNLVPEGWRGFLDTFGVYRIGQVRLNDNHGDREVHLVPGEGNVDFPALFARLKGLNYEGPFILDFGTEEEKVRVREWFVTLLGK